jgi:hypothetical protein
VRAAPISHCLTAPGQSEAEQKAEIADKNLLKALNTAYFNRLGDERTQPSLAEMKSLKTEISVTADCGVRSLRGIEAAANVKTLDIRQNPLQTLSDVDWSKKPKFAEVVLISTQLENLNGVNRIPENIQNLIIMGDDESAARGYFRARLAALCLACEPELKL